MPRLVFDIPRVFDFMATKMPMKKIDDMKVVGLEHEGQILAGTLYERFNGHNVWVHIAAEQGRGGLHREFVWYCLHYPFEEMKVARMTAYIDASNTASRRVAEHLNFSQEAALAGAANDGGDAILYVLWKKDSPHLGGRHARR
jgi:RimJ/RimL family protein N-acetyltransferase